MNDILRIENLSKNYGKTKALIDINSSFNHGIYGLLGANGSGKSTLIKSICALIKVESGSIRYHDKPIASWKENYFDHIGYMPQQQEMYDSFKVEEFLWYLSSLKGMASNEAKIQIPELINVVHLEDKKYSYIKNLSGGMKQRVLLAGALLNKPEILLLDEPTAGLDPKERNDMKLFLSDIAKDKVVIFATHLISDIEYIANEVIFMKKGVIEQRGKPEELVEAINTYEAKVSQEEFIELKGVYICSYVKEEEYLKVRYINEKPLNQEDVKVHTRLEDAFLYFLEYEHTKE